MTENTGSPAAPEAPGTVPSEARGLSPVLGLAVLFVCFFMSGAAGLIYEVVWSRYLALFLGSSGQAHAIILATYMGGLALGAALLGRRADRSPNPLRLYVMLELGIALAGGLYPRIFPAVRYVFLTLVQGLGLSAWSTSLAGAAACALTILIPTVLMGGTLPVLSRVLTTRRRSIGRRIAGLYYINSFGAVAGALAAGFWLVPKYGLALTTLGAAGLNLAAAVGARLLEAVLKTGNRQGATGNFEERTGASALPGGEERARMSALPGDALLVLVVITLSGFTAMAYEVVWIRLLSMVLGSSSTSFALMLAAFITGITLGSFLLALKRRDRGHYQILGWCELAMGVSVLASMAAWQRLPFVIFWLRSNIIPSDANFSIYQAIVFVLCFAVMVGPTVFMGAALPAASRVVARGLGDLGRRVGDVYALNTLGTLAGALLTGLVLLPWLGLERVVESAAALNMLLGLVVLFAYPRLYPMPRAPRWAAAALAVLAAGAYTLSFGGLDIRPFSSAVFRTYPGTDMAQFRAACAQLRVLFHKDGNDATVSIVRHSPDAGRVTSLVINGKADASDGADMITQQMISHVPLLIHPAPRDVLVVGLGSGVSAGVAALYEPRRVDCVELLPEVIETARFFERANYGVRDNPLVNIIQQDAKTYLQLTAERYDAILSEPTNPWISGVAGLFTREFYGMCRDRLAPGGLFAQWIQCYEMPDAAVYSILRTFNETFPYSTLFNINQGNMALVGSLTPFAPDLARMEGVAARPAIAGDLARAGILGLAPILAMQMVNKSDADAPYVTSAPGLSDFFPALEYLAIRGLFTGSRATGVAALDCRGLAPGRAGLWIERYRPAAPPPETVFSTWAQRLAVGKPLYAFMNQFWCTLWARYYPDSAELRLARARLGEPGVEAARENINALADDYHAWRNCLGRPGDLKLRQGLEAQVGGKPEDRPAALIKLGDLAADAGQFERALEHYRNALGMLTDRTGKPLAIELELRRGMLADLLLASAETLGRLGRWDEARPLLESVDPGLLSEDAFNARWCRVLRLRAGTVKP